MKTVICTGTGGQGSGLAAAATASAAAQQGRKTLLTSVGPSHSLPSLLGTPLGSVPQTIAPNLAAWVVDTAINLREVVEEMRPRFIASLARLSSDELPLIPGIDFFLCLERLRYLAVGYDLVVIDAGHHDSLLRVLSLPDSFRWMVRLLFGLDREPGRSQASLNRAMLPTSLIPYDWLNRLQDARVQFEHMRDSASVASRTTVRYALRPDVPALEEARLAVPALHLHGLVVDALVVGPLLPPDTGDPRLQPFIEQQQDIAAEATRIWQPRPVVRLPMTLPGSFAALESLGQALYGSQPPADLFTGSPPIVYGSQQDPFVAISVPGIRRDALNLTMSGDELIIQVGPYRRHILLPDALRGRSNIRASREGEQLIVRLRSQ
jgi:anion-transporting  ArsA/GET3 family ATPase